MSLPQFKEQIVMDIEAAIVEYTQYLVEQQQADYAQLRAYQGRIAGLMQAREIVSERFRKAY
jgi:hypothetical protein